MNCFECAKVRDVVPAVGICQHCGVGLCMDHLAETHDYRVGGTIYSCGHTLPPRDAPHSLPPAIEGRRDRVSVA